jgi:hypothetical protein
MQFWWISIEEQVFGKSRRKSHVTGIVWELVDRLSGYQAVRSCRVRPA